MQSRFTAFCASPQNAGNKLAFTKIEDGAAFLKIEGKPFQITLAQTPADPLVLLGSHR
eukprot:EC832173.1.p3 GENE.EC832173.1~~EC832173.1.p3  ORF type:complete len:58 (+),score=8.98 EC832173.1:3-176(+)